MRAPRSQNLKVEADYGYCAAKDEYYSGLRANVLIDPRGVVVGITITAANVDERDSAFICLLRRLTMLQRRKNPIAVAPILRKGGAHSKSKSTERTKAKKIVKQEAEGWLRRHNP